MLQVALGGMPAKEASKFMPTQTTTNSTSRSAFLAAYWLSTFAGRRVGNIERNGE
jgi:hypothetical protein